MRREKPLVSIVVPAYNEEKEIQNALSEMKKQTYPNTEVIVIDDGSTDKTFEAARESGNSIKNFLIVKTNHAGPSASRNAGVKQSKGDIVFFGECDCVYDQDYLEQAVKCLEQEPEAGAVCLTGAPLIERNTIANRCVNLENILQHNLLNSGKIKPFYAWVYRKSVLEQINGFDETLFQAEDKDLFQRAIQAGCKVAWVPGIHWRHKRSETMIELAGKWFSRARMRLLYSLKHRRRFDIGKSIFPVWLLILGLVLMVFVPLLGSALVLLVALGILYRSLRTTSRTWKSVQQKSIFLYYPVFVLVRNFSSGLGYSYGLFRYVGLRIGGGKITYESV
ncbi:MAG: glycosyltransferase [Thaumarchaeota archaeon]|nr:glycosyltransferase [Nitrososphaerota archaeon]